MKIHFTLVIYSVIVATIVKGNPDPESVDNDKVDLSRTISSKNYLRGAEIGTYDSRNLAWWDAIGDMFTGCADGNKNDNCSVVCQCSGENTCEAGSQKCRAPGQQGDACHLTRPCGSGLKCEAGAHVCRSPGTDGDRCHLTMPCASGYECQLGSQKCVPAESSPDCWGKWCSYQYIQKGRTSECKGWTKAFGVKLWCHTYKWNTVNTYSCKHLDGSRPLVSYGPSPLVKFERISGTGSNTECEKRDDIGDNGCSWNDDSTWGDLPFGAAFLKIWQCN